MGGRGSGSGIGGSGAVAATINRANGLLSRADEARKENENDSGVAGMLARDLSKSTDDLRKSINSVEHFRKQLRELNERKAAYGSDWSKVKKEDRDLFSERKRQARENIKTALYQVEHHTGKVERDVQRLSQWREYKQKH